MAMEPLYNDTKTVSTAVALRWTRLTLRMLLIGMSVKVPVGTGATAGAAGARAGVGAPGAAGDWQHTGENRSRLFS